ncbi:hypothetical protein ACJA27_01525 [Mycoplasmopsis lipophila]|uniref:hypothetical protein n=1 Tax=Mycoplasmopsis lipophila TaxID=2117 RepID=UPI003872BF46
MNIIAVIVKVIAPTSVNQLTLKTKIKYITTHWAYKIDVAIIKGIWYFLNTKIPVKEKQNKIKKIEKYIK